MKLKDVSQSTSLYEIADVIQQLNPDAEIRVAKLEYDPQATKRLYSSVPMDQLVLPEGFYSNDKNGVTNKHNTKSGMYCALKVEDIKNADERVLMPKVEKIVEIERPSTKEKIEQVKNTIVNAVLKLQEKVMNRGVETSAKHR